MKNQLERVRIYIRLLWLLPVIAAIVCIDHFCSHPTTWDYWWASFALVWMAFQCFRLALRHAPRSIVITRYPAGQGGTHAPSPDAIAALRYGNTDFW